MRLLLALALILLFLWLQKSQTTNSLHGKACEETASMSKAAASLLLSPLSVYSVLVSTLLRLVLSVPSLVLSSVYHTVLLLLAWPWCFAAAAVSTLLTCFHVALYLLHLALVLGAVAILILTQPNMADRDASERVLDRRNAERRSTKTSLLFGRRVVLPG